QKRPDHREQDQHDDDRSTHDRAAIREQRGADSRHVRHSITPRHARVDSHGPAYDRHYMGSLRGSVLVGLVASIASTTACLRTTAFVCSGDQSCTENGKTGRCEPSTSYCSYPDPGCAGGSRYGNAAGALSNQCVGGGTGSDGGGGGSDMMNNGMNCFG